MKFRLPHELDPATSHTLLARKIRVRQARELVKQMPLSVGGNISLSLLCVAVFQGNIPPLYLLSWLGLFWITAIPGIRQWVKFGKVPEPEIVSVGLIYRAALYSIIVALPWAVGNWFGFDYGSREDQLFLVFVTGGLTAGVVSLLATIPIVSLIFVHVIVTPLIIRMLTIGDMTQLAMASMLSIYVCLLSLFVRSSYRGFKAGIEMEIDRQKIINQLRDTHQRLQRTLERSSDEILLFNADERLVMSNSAKTGSLLFPEDELKEGISLDELVHASVRSGLVLSAAGHGKDWLDEFSIWRRHPGNELIVQTSDARTCSLMAQPTTDGEMFLIIKDISALSAQSAIARESTQRLMDFAETAADWMWEMDESTKLTVLTQPGGSNILAENLLGQKFLDLPILALADAERRQIAEKLAEHRAFRDQRLKFTHDEGTRTLSLSGKPFFGENGKYRGHRGTFRDVTREVRVQKELVEAKERAEVGSRSKSEFLAHMSHELRTPLNAILGFSEIMSMGLYGKIEQPKYVEYVDTIHESGAHLLSIINDILDISRIESGKVELNEQEVDFAGLFESCMNLISGRASDAGHGVQIELMPGMPKLWADERYTKQILINLLGNAVKFTPHGGTITLGAETTGRGCIRFWVRDNGPGMSLEDQVRALIPFDRGSAMTKSETQGAGLGLPLCKMLAELHEGQLTLKSNATGGLTVSVEYPQQRTIERKISVHA